MVIIDSPFHISFTGHNELPTIACVGKCKKTWWPIDLEDVAKDVCPMCGSVTSAAMEGVHYSVLARANRDLRYKDFRNFSVLTAQEKEELKAYISSGAKVSHVSAVKKAFEEKAKLEWCS